MHSISFRLDYQYFVIPSAYISTQLPIFSKQTQTTTMAPASPLAIATSSVNRLVKEEASYHRELEEQTKRIAKLESEAGTEDPEGNREYLIKQEVVSF